MSTSGLGGKGTLVNGVRKIKVNIPIVGAGAGQVEQGTKDALDAALVAWNAKTSTTKIQFDPVSSGGDISMIRDAARVASDGFLCAEGFPGGNVYFDDYLNGLGASPTSTINGRSHADTLKYLFSHELGHVLNVDQYSSGNSIMNGLSGGTTCQDGVANYWPSNNGVIENDDATKAADCGNKLDSVESPGDGFGESEPNEECFDIYWVHVWWTMNSQNNWVIAGYSYTFLYTTCNEDPYPNG